MTKMCTCKTLALVAGSVAMIAASATGEGTGLETSNTVGNSDQIDRADLVKPSGSGEAVISSRVGTPFADGQVCTNAHLILDNSSTDYDNSKTTGGWDTIVLTDPNQNFCIGNTGDLTRQTYWFQFVANSTSALAHTCNSVSTDSSAQMYSGTCAGLTEIACSEDVCGPTTFNSYLYGEGLIVGQTYYVQVGAWTGTAAGPYTLDVISPAPDVTVCGLAAVNVLDNDGPCADLDWVQNGNAVDTPSVPAGQNNNYGCVEPDLGAGIGGTENDPIRFQALGAIASNTTVSVCGQGSVSFRSDSAPTALFVDFDWYTFTSPVDPANDLAGPPIVTREFLNYDYFSNGSHAFFVIQNGVDNLRGCDGDTVGDPDISFAASAYYPISPGTGAILDGNAHWTNSVLLEDGEGYNIIIRKTRFTSAPALCINPVGREYEFTMSFSNPPSGACCETDDTCSDNTFQFDCFGIYRGNGTLCNALPLGSECPVALPCPVGALVENVGAGEVIGGNDTINVGCNADPNPVTGQVIPIAPDTADCAANATWCGTTGNFQGNTRDLDWFRFILATDAQVTITLDAQVPMQMFMVETFDGNFIECDGETTVGFEQSTVKDGQIVLTETLCAGNYYVIPATNGFTDFQIKPNVPTDTGWDYVMSITCDTAPVGGFSEVGACCLKDATCFETDPCTCGNLNGLYYGEFSLCTDVNVLCCLTTCDGTETLENEDANGAVAGTPNCLDGYHDLFNGGCGADNHEQWTLGNFFYTGAANPPVGAVLVDPFLDTLLNQVWCGRVGEFFTNLRLDDLTVQANEDVRDTDYFRVQHSGGNLFATLTPDQFTGQVFLFEEKTPGGPTAVICDTVKFADTPIDAAARQTQNLASQTVLPCSTDALDFGIQVAGQYYLIVAAVNTVFGGNFDCAQGKTYTFSYGDTSCAPCSNVDGSVDLVTNLADLNLVLFNFGSSGNAPGTLGDTDCDGDTDLNDLNQVLFDFGNVVGC